MTHDTTHPMTDPSEAPAAHDTQLPATEALSAEAAATDAVTPPDTAVPPALSGSGFLRRSIARWVVMGAVRWAYRRWTRIAAIIFPEDTRRAQVAAAVGLPLPDQLNLSWITPHLAVGGRFLSTEIHRLAARGVGAIVDTRSEHQDDAQLLGAQGIEFLYLPTEDTFPLTVPQLCEGTAWVNARIAEGRSVLIHCEHGVGRSVLLAAAALVASGMSAHEAMALIQRKRWQAAPNHRQMRRLQEFEHTIRGGIMDGATGGAHDVCTPPAEDTSGADGTA